MKKGVAVHEVVSAGYSNFGEKYSTIMSYFVPEYITCLVIYSMPFWIDSYFIGQLGSTSTYAALESTNNLLHLLMKIAEAFSIGTVIVVGNNNGQQHFAQAGRTLCDSFVLMVVLGGLLSALLFCFPEAICFWYGLAPDVVTQAAPFLKVRAVGIFFTFVAMAFIGFLHGIKNTRTPMKLFVGGAALFTFFDYVFIFGKFGFPAFGLMGSAYASLLQYLFIGVVACGYILSNKKYRPYMINVRTTLYDKQYIKTLLRVSWPIVLDKAILACAYIWLGRVISPIGTSGVASFSVIKNMERFAFLPAIASAQVITFLVSNDYAIANWEGIRANIKKVIMLSFGMVLAWLLFFSLHAHSIASLFDKNGNFYPLAARAFPLISLLVIFDLLQLILSAALRGAGNVKTVMIVRFIVCFGYFVPLSYFLSQLPINDDMLKIVLIYGSFYVGNGIMSVMYIIRLQSKHWNTRLMKDSL